MSRSPRLYGVRDRPLERPEGKWGSGGCPMTISSVRQLCYAGDTFFSESPSQHIWRYPGQRQGVILPRGWWALTPDSKNYTSLNEKEL